MQINGERKYNTALLLFLIKLSHPRTIEQIFINAIV